MPWTKLVADADLVRCGGDDQVRVLTYGEALWEAQRQALEADPRVFIMGEGVDDPGGIFGSTKDLHRYFGSERVFDLPIAENGCTGFAVGAAITGMRPILVHMRCDFLFMSMDQIVNHAAKWRTMFGDRQRVPLVIRSIIGRGWGSAAQHSQSPQGIFLQVPGLKVVMPAGAYDAKGLLLASIAADDPVIFIEHRWLYGHSEAVPEAMYVVPLGKGQIRRPGLDVTIVAVSYMVHEALLAAQALAKEDIDVEVLDMRSIKPLDKALLCESVVKTGRLVVADTGHIVGGWSAEIAAIVSEQAFGALRAPIRRLGLPDVPTPAAACLEKRYYSDKDTIMQAVRQVVGYDG